MGYVVVSISSTLVEFLAWLVGATSRILLTHGRNAFVPLDLCGDSEI
jgi:hypothetical protein